MDLTTEAHLRYAELMAGGLTYSDVVSRMRQGQLTRIRRGIYGTAPDLTPEESHLRLILATMPDVHPGNVLSHESAALLHGLPVSRDGLTRVTMIRRTAGHTDTSATLRVRNTRITDEEVTTIDELPVTTAARTAIDLSRTQHYAWGVAACDAALRLGVSRDALRDSVKMHPRLKGLPKARLAVAFADGLAESPAESISRVQFARYGVPKPVSQFEVYDQGGEWVARCDFGWPALGIVGECDGMGKYAQLLRPGQTPEMAIKQEKRREEAIREAGYWVVRWDWDLMWNGDALAQRILRTMRKQGVRASA